MRIICIYELVGVESEREGKLRQYLPPTHLLAWLSAVPSVGGIMATSYQGFARAVSLLTGGIFPQ